jgi:hypothetical protein
MSRNTETVEGGTREEMSLDIEDVVNGGVDRDEALGRAGRFEACILRSLRRTGWCEFSPRLLAR